MQLSWGWLSAQCSSLHMHVWAAHPDVHNETVINICVLLQTVTCQMSLSCNNVFLLQSFMCPTRAFCNSNFLLQILMCPLRAFCKTGLSWQRLPTRMKVMQLLLKEPTSALWSRGEPKHNHNFSSTFKAHCVQQSCLSALVNTSAMSDKATNFCLSTLFACTLAVPKPLHSVVKGSVSSCLLRLSCTRNGLSAKPGACFI